MIDFQERAERERLQAACLALEVEAGVSQAMARAREGRFIPLGIDGVKCSPEAYFADEHDHFREHTRDAYFGVPDVEHRKKMIHSQRQLNQHINSSLALDVKRLNGELAEAKAKANRQPWTMAALVAVGAVALGYWAYQNVGALAGAVGGFFFGQGVISNAKAQSLAEITQLAESLSLAEGSTAERKSWPEVFCSNEEFTGIRDKQLDEESAYANVMHRASVA